LITPSLAVNRTSLSETLAQRMTEFIRSNSLEVGDRLPSVKDLARHFAVATPTLREALHRLEATGVIEIKHGSGIYVRQLGSRMMLPNPYYGDLDIHTILDLFEARSLLEPELAARAASQATPAQMATLRAIVSEAATHLTGIKADDTPLLKANEAFHSAIAQMSGNAVLGQLVTSLLELYAKEQLLVQHLYNDRVQDHREHLAICDAIEGAQAERARTLMEEHLSGVQRVIVQLIERGGGKTD
jgi:GntR family transcriptional repressor for pyruvate dehydrogenase complex